MCIGLFESYASKLSNEILYVLYYALKHEILVYISKLSMRRVLLLLVLSMYRVNY